MRPTLALCLVLGAASCRSTLPFDPGDAGPAACRPAAAPGTPLRLLTRAEYDRTVQQLLGTSLAPARDFPPEPLVRSLDNTAALLRPTPDGVAHLLLAAEALGADALANHRDKVLPCSGQDDACVERIVGGFGVRAWRRPLTTEERLQLTTLFGTARAGTDFDTALSVTLQAMLQAPQFLYRDEAPAGPSPVPLVRLGPYQLATRLSYFLWGTTPDDELLTAAGSGVLDTPEGLAAQADRLLADPRGAEGVLRFLSLLLSLDAVAQVEKDPAVYPGWSHGLSASWRTSLELYLQEVLAREPTVRSLLRTDAFYADQALGAPDAGAGFVRLVPQGHLRRGLLAQPGFLAQRALPGGSSPVRRGVFVLTLACQPPPPPPGGLAVAPPTPSASATTRERFATHSTDPACHACHQYIDPPGFAFEHYDGLGQWRDQENGRPIDATGGLVAARDPSLLQAVDGLDQLQEVLAGSRQVHDCLAQELYRYALGRELVPEDACAVAQLGEAFWAAGGSFPALARAIVTSPGFQQNLNPELVP